MLKYVKFTDSITDAWFLRTVFIGNSDSVASYKHWFCYDDDRKIRGSDIRYVTDFKFCFEV